MSTRDRLGQWTKPGVNVEVSIRLKNCEHRTDPLLGWELDQPSSIDFPKRLAACYPHKRATAS